MASKPTALLAAAYALILGGSAGAHDAARGWPYPPACCKGNEVGGDCERIPGASVKIGPRGFSVTLLPGDHHLVTRQHLFQIPYGDALPSGDHDFHICLHPSEEYMNCFFAPPDSM
ncbi:MAG: hypothetical protein E5W81_21145 [Mesorhizobium sp.]|nr:MAG: hypothetical protein E5V36_04325 [Mesorhizobium sp.]TKB60010.1 MAG: hypothetical protein E5W81_21145 [Mesorhizobium sp.]